MQSFGKAAYSVKYINKKIVKTENFNSTYGFVLDTNQRVIMDCLNWMNSEFMYPDDVTDVIIFHQCTDGQEDTLRKVKT